jgi:hypothetical protein
MGDEQPCGHDGEPSPFGPGSAERTVAQRAGRGLGEDSRQGNHLRVHSALVGGPRPCRVASQDAVEESECTHVCAMSSHFC